MLLIGCSFVLMAEQQVKQINQLLMFHLWMFVQGLGPRQREEEGLRPRSQREVFSSQTHEPAAQTHEERLVRTVCVLQLHRVYDT